MPPTLLVKNKIELSKNAPSAEKEKNEQLVAKDFITWKFFDKRRGVSAKKLKDRIFLLRSGTGSGKTKTIAPDFYEKYEDRKIALLQPTITVTIESAKDIDKIYPKLKIGETLGFSTSTNKKNIKRGVMVSTYDTLLLQLKSDKDEDFIRKYSLVIIDEVHTRNKSIDLIMLYMKNLISRNLSNPQCPFLLLMSATFNPHDYLNYFDIDINDNFIEVPGTTPFDVEDIYLEKSANRYDYKAIDIVTEIDKVKEGIPNNIILFEPSIARSRFPDFIKEKGLNILPIKFDSVNYKTNSTKNAIDLPVEKFATKTFKPTRKAFYATPVAETGVTIDGLKYCLDSGLEIKSTFIPQMNLNFLPTIPVTQASAMQRRGRVGRNYEGVRYALYTKENFNNMRENKLPEVITEDVSEFLLDNIIQNKDNAKFDIFSLDIMDKPPLDSIKYSLNKLFVLGYINKEMQPTELGELFRQTQKISIEEFKLFTSALYYDIPIYDVICLYVFGTANITGPKYKYRKIIDFSKIKGGSVYDNVDEDYYKNMVFIGDMCIDRYVIYQEYIEEVQKGANLEKWAEKEDVKYKNLQSAIYRKEEIIKYLLRVGINPYLDKPTDIKSLFKNHYSIGVDYLSKVKSCIYEGFKLNLATWNNETDTYDVQAYGISIAPPFDFQVVDAVDKVPKHIVCFKTEISSGKFKKFITRNYSIMDGFVNIDETFITS